MVQTIDKNDTKFMFPEIKATINKYVQDYRCDYYGNDSIWFILSLYNPLEGNWEFKCYLSGRKTEYTAEDFILNLEKSLDRFLNRAYGLIERNLLGDEPHIRLARKLNETLQLETDQIETLIKELRYDIENCDDLQKFRRV